MIESGAARAWTLAMVLLAGCTMGGGPGGFGGGGGHDAPEPVTVVEVEAVERGAVIEQLTSHAVVESERQADLMPGATGQVLELRVGEGDAVEQGEILAVLESVALGAGAERARADVEKQSRELEDVRALHSRGVVSDQELADAEYALQTARASLREASHNYGQARLTAPFDGVVAARDIRVGGMASSGSRAFRIVDLSALRVVASLPERDVSRVKVGQPALLTSAYDEDAVAAGEVVRIAPVIDASSGTFRVTVELEPGQEVLRPGQFVSVAIEVDRHDDVVVVPRRAVVYEEGDPVVYAMVPAPEEDPEQEDASEPEGGIGAWIQEIIAGLGLGGGGESNAEGEEEEEPELPELPEMVASRQPLELGLVDDRGAEVLAGVEVGTQVIVVGQSNLRDGAPVRTPAAMEAEARAEDAAEDASAESEG